MSVSPHFPEWYLVVAVVAVVVVVGVGVDVLPVLAAGLFAFKLDRFSISPQFILPFFNFTRSSIEIPACWSCKSIFVTPSSMSVGGGEGVELLLMLLLLLLLMLLLLLLVFICGIKPL